MENLTLIGTSHIAEESVKEIKEAFKDKPDLLAVELDRNRMMALLQNERPSYPISLVRKIGVMGYLFAIIGGFIQRKLGSAVGISPGAEMQAALKEARKNKTHVFLIDQNIEITLRKLSDIPFREKLKMAWEIIKGPFSKNKMIIDLRKVPPKELIKELTAEMARMFPNLYRVMVEERNQIMVDNLKRIREMNPDKTILAIVGAGHVEGMRELL